MKHKLLYLSQEDIIQIGVGMKEIITAIENAMIDKGNGETSMPPKSNMYIDGNKNYLNAMPAYVPSQQAAGLKWVSAYPENFKKDLPYVNGLIILNDPDTGLPLAIMDAVWITTYRTGAATALSAKYLAKPVSSRLGVLGCGVQGKSNILALSAEFQLKKIFVFDVDLEKSKQFASMINDEMGIETFPVKHPREAVSGCDIIVTAGPITKPPHATIQSGWLDPGAFASLVDYDAYWHPEALDEINKFCTDDTPQFLSYKGLGYFEQGPEIYADLGELAAGIKEGRQGNNEKNMAANLGNAIFDMVTASLIYKKAKEKGVGQLLSL